MLPVQAVNAQPGGIQAEIAKRQAAEARVKELEAIVLQLQRRLAVYQGRKPPTRLSSKELLPEPEETGPPSDDPIDRAIGDYLDRHPEFPVYIQKVGPNHYVFGDRGTVYVTQRGEHFVVRVGGGFKSLKVFMDERALMVTRENASALAEKQALSPPVSP